MKHDYEKIEQLLIQKSFQELDTTQKEWVSYFMSEREYEMQRRVLLESQIVLQEKNPLPISNLVNLQTHFKKQHQKSWVDIFQQPIPAYQTMLLALGGGIAVWWLQPAKIETKTEIKTEIVESIQRDTIIQEKIIYKDKILYKTQTITAEPQRDTIYMPFAERNLFYKEGKKEVLEGKSMQEMKDLMEFIVKMD